MAKLKRLEESDILRIDFNDQSLIITKQETGNIVRGFLQAEFNNEITSLKEHFFKVTEEIINNDNLKQNVNNKMCEIEKSIDSYIEYKFDQLAQKISEHLLSRAFNEEVERKVNELIEKKKLKGKF